MILDQQALASRAAAAASRQREVAFAYLSPELELIQVSDDFVCFINSNDLQLPLLGRVVTDLLPIFVGLEDTCTQLLEGEIADFQLENVNETTPEGGVRYFNYTLLPIDQDQPGEGLLLLVENKTRNGRLQHQLIQERNELNLLRHQLELANNNLSQLSQMKMLLLSIAAHDMRTPLTSITGYAELMQRGALNSQQEKFMAIIQRQSEQLNRLINNILDLDQIEQGRLSIKPTHCVFNEIVSEVVEALALNAQLRKLNMEVFISPELMPLHADPMRLRQIVFNMLGNAIKYSPHGGDIRVAAYANATEIVLEVANSGDGLTGDQLEHLFDLYYRTEGARQREAIGAGLGLFVVKSLVEGHHGRIMVESELNEGIQFTIYLPRNPVQANVIAGNSDE